MSVEQKKTRKSRDGYKLVEVKTTKLQDGTYSITQVEEPDKNVIKNQKELIKKMLKEQGCSPMMGGGFNIDDEYRHWTIKHHIGKTGNSYFTVHIMKVSIPRRVNGYEPISTEKHSSIQTAFKQLNISSPLKIISV